MRETLLGQIIAPTVVPHGDIPCGSSKIMSRSTVQGLLAHCPPPEDTLRQHADDGDKDNDAEVRRQSGGVVREVDTQHAVSDAEEDDADAEDAMDLPVHAGRLGFSIGVVKEEAEAGLTEDEQEDGDAETLMGGFQLRASLILDGDVDAEGEANHDADGGAALPDEVQPECQAQWEPDEKCT